ncbi:hypothetical protein BJX76DRAFT_315447 [Aspergillus varians]
MAWLQLAKVMTHCWHASLPALIQMIKSTLPALFSGMFTFACVSFCPTKASATHGRFSCALLLHFCLFLSLSIPCSNNSHCKLLTYARSYTFHHEGQPYLTFGHDPGCRDGCPCGTCPGPGRAWHRHKMGTGSRLEASHSHSHSK